MSLRVRCTGEGTRMGTIVTLVNVVNKPPDEELYTEQRGSVDSLLTANRLIPSPAM